MIATRDDLDKLFDAQQYMVESVDPESWENLKASAKRLGIDEDDLRFLLKMRYRLRAMQEEE